MKMPTIDQQAMIDQFTQASAKGAEQLRRAVHDATLGALQGRELSLKNIRGVIASVTQAASAGAAKAAAPDQAQSMLDGAVAGIDDALLKAVDANRVALDRLVAQGVSLRETQLKKALADLEKLEDTMIASITKAAASAGGPLAGPWSQVLEKFGAGGTRTGNQAATAVEQLAGEMHNAMRESRAAGLKAAQALAESYTALVSGVLIGMSDALREGSAGAKTARKK